MAKYTTIPPMRSGIPLGGIGTGSIELRPDGEFHEWQIANPERFSKVCGGRASGKGASLSGSLSFYVRTSVGNGAVLRRLGMGFGSGQGLNEEEYNYRMYSFNKTVEKIEYESKFPTARLDYTDSALPVKISLEAAAPFVPYDEKTSGTPGFFLTFKVCNDSPQPATVSLAGKLRCIIPGNGKRNRVAAGRDYTVLTMDKPDDRNAGSISLAVSNTDAEITAIPADYSGFMNEYVSHGEFGVVEESFLFGLRRTGKLPFNGRDSEITRPFSVWPDADDINRLDDAEAASLLKKLSSLAFADSIIDRNTVTDSTLPQTPEGRRALLRCICRNGADIQSSGSWGDGALCSEFVLAPGETRSISFILSWYFPDLVSSSGRRVGHFYENLFSGSEEVSQFLQDNRTEILSKTASFVQNMYNSSFPEGFADSVSEQLATLVKSAWWIKNGDFGVWEGLGSCGFHTTDITYHGSAGIVTLFPVLQKKQMEMGARFQREDGRVHHFFTPDFESVDGGFDRVDMNPQFVLLVCRDYFATGDFAYLKRMWHHICAAMDSIELLDTDNDGLPDKNAGRNTYDAWHFCGTSTYISVLWLASLRAAAVIADKLDENERALHWRKIEKRGAESVESLLFNGSYYDLWKCGDATDRCCMTDQLDGDFFSRLIGNGAVLDDAHVRAALGFIYNLNYSEENGLINAGYPENTSATVFTFRNCQGLANWSGIEYMMASYYLMLGDYEKGFTVMNTVRERYTRAGELFNHAECGDHYYRPLSSWSLMQALGGMTVNTAEKRVSFTENPLCDNYNEPWFTTTGYGQIIYSHGTYTVTCVYGTLDADEVYFGRQAANASIHIKAGASLTLFKQNVCPVAR